MGNVVLNVSCNERRKTVAHAQTSPGLFLTSCEVMTLSRLVERIRGRNQVVELSLEAKARFGTQSSVLRLEQTHPNAESRD
jgi:hypothetical protein